MTVISVATFAAIVQMLVLSWSSLVTFSTTWQSQDVIPRKYLQLPVELFEDVLLVAPDPPAASVPWTCRALTGLPDNNGVLRVNPKENIISKTVSNFLNIFLYYHKIIKSGNWEINISLIF